MSALTEDDYASRIVAAALQEEPQFSNERPRVLGEEVAQAVSVAAAYFEDTLQSLPGIVISAGTMGAERLSGLLIESGISEGEMRVREMIEPAMLTGGATTTRVPREWMAGVRGALRS
jgi:type IV pilus assembly protein PilM